MKFRENLLAENLFIVISAFELDLDFHLAQSFILDQKPDRKNVCSTS